MNSKCFVSIVSIALAAVFGADSASALDAYLKVAGIDGEATHPAFLGWSDVLSYNISVQKTCSGGGGCAATLSPMFVQKYVDKASPKFFGAVLTGTRYPTAQIDIRRSGAGANPPEFALWEFEDVLITSYSTGGSAQSALEALSLDYQKITYTYWPQLPDGSIGTPVMFAWNRQTNTSSASGNFADIEFVTNFAATSVPEPGTFALVGCAMTMFALWRRTNGRASRRAVESPMRVSR